MRESRRPDRPGASGEPFRSKDGAVAIVRLTALSHSALALVEEYLDVVGVQQRDSPAQLRQLLRDPSAGLWLARLGQEAVGCVMLRPLAELTHAAECKRLYVRPHARDRGIADQLLAAMERHAKDEAFAWIYLDSKDDLMAALRLYRRRGYEACARYNDNPQATVFLRKRL